MSEKVTPPVMEDPEDLELKKLMGARFQDRPATDKEEEKPDWGKKDRRKEEPEKKALNASWAPVKAERTEIQRIVNCAKGTVMYGGLSAILFWWQQAGLLASEAAWPSFIILALLAGLKIGSCMARG